MGEDLIELAYGTMLTEIIAHTALYCFYMDFRYN